MAWKIERWLTDIFPGENNIYSEYRSLSPRELATVSVAVLDAALAELLVLRLRDESKEAESFLGLNGDGRAPVSSFGARIQLGLLLGLLTPNDAAILRTIKDIRNQFAHRVKINFLSPSIVKANIKLHSLWVARNDALIENGIISGTTSQLTELGRHIPHVAEAGEGLLLSVFTIYHAYLHRMHSRVERIGEALKNNIERDSNTL